MTADGRVSAWLGAWALIEGAQAFLKRNGNLLPVGASIPVQYWGLIAEAQVLMGLANAPEDVGTGAGHCLDEQRKASERTRQMAEKISGAKSSS